MKFRQEGLYWEKNISKYRRGDTMIEILHPLDPAILFVDSLPSPPLTQTLMHRLSFQDRVTRGHI